MDYSTEIKQAEEHFKKKHQEISSILETNDFYIAGGAIRDFMQCHEEPKDYDLFFNNFSMWEGTVRRLLKSSIDWDAIEERKSSISCINGDGLILDLVYYPYDDGLSLIDSFDFTINCAAYGKDGLVLHDDFLHDLYNKEIVVNKLKTPNVIMERIYKFIDRGYTMDPMYILDVQEYVLSQKGNAKAEVDDY